MFYLFLHQSSQKLNFLDPEIEIILKKRKNERGPIVFCWITRGIITAINNTMICSLKQILISLMNVNKSILIILGKLYKSEKSNNFNVLQQNFRKISFAGIFGKYFT